MTGGFRSASLPWSRLSRCAPRGFPTTSRWPRWPPHRETLSAFVAANLVLAALAYVRLYVAAVAFSLPGAVFLTLAGGFLFGAVAGTALTVVGATIGATLVFLFAQRLFGADALDRLGPKARALGEGIRRNAASYLLVLRLGAAVPLLSGEPRASLRGRTAAGLSSPPPRSASYPERSCSAWRGRGSATCWPMGGAFNARAVLTPEILGALLGLAVLSLAAIPLKAWFARS